mgnify:CR=1 FL=1
MRSRIHTKIPFRRLQVYNIFLNTSTIVGTALLRRLLSPFRSCCYFCFCVFWSRSITMGRVLLLYLGFNAFTIQFNSPRITNNIANRWYHQITTLSLRLPHMQHSITYNQVQYHLYFCVQSIQCYNNQLKYISDMTE